MSATADLDKILAQHDVGVSAEEFLWELDVALSTVSGQDSEPLSGTEAAFLRVHGGERAADVVDDDPQVVRRQRASSVAHESADTFASTMSIAETATLLGVDRSRVSQLLSHRRLWAFPMGRNKRVPRWQFLRGTLLPNLGQVVEAIPPGLAPQAIDGLMTTRQSEFDGASPVEFLADGGDPRAVAGLVSGLGRW